MPNCTTKQFGYVVNTSGGYWVQIKDEHNCILNLNPTPAGVAVKKAPTAFIKGKQNLCLDVTERFTALTGMPASANLNYFWNYYFASNPTNSVLSATSKDWDLSIPWFGDFIITLKVEEVNGCSSPIQSFAITVHPPPAVPVLDVTLVDCDRYELELACTNQGVYSGNASFNWSTGAGGPTTYVYNGGTYRLWITEENGCKSYSDIPIPYPPNFYFWRFPTGCYDFCPEHLPRYVFPMQWTYGSTPGFENWEWRIDGNPVQNNGGNCSSCTVGACFCGYKAQNNAYCQFPCRLEIGLQPDNEGPGDYTWMLENELLCAQESDIMQIRINDCCEIDLRIVEIRCLHTSADHSTYEFKLDVLNVPCDAWYNLIIKDNLGFPITPVMNPYAQLLPGTNHLQGIFEAPVTALNVNFYIEVFCHPICYGQALNVSLPVCVKKRKGPENPEHQQDETITKASLVVVPNPAHTLVTFHYRLPENEDTKPVNVALFVTDATGRPVRQFKITELTGMITTDITTFTPGVYFVTLASNKRPDVTKKLLIIRN